MWLYLALIIFLNALESRGYYIFYLGNIYRLKVQSSMESVEVGIHDYINRYKRDLTAEELKKNPSGGKWIYVDEKTNKFVLCIYNDYGRSVKNIIETDENKLENLLNDVIIEITKEILNQRDYRLSREKAEHRRYLEQEKIRREKERRANLLEEINKKNTADSIRKYVEDCSISYASGKLKKEDFENWKQWALGFADELDPEIS